MRRPAIPNRSAFVDGSRSSGQEPALRFVCLNGRRLCLFLRDAEVARDAHRIHAALWTLRADKSANVWIVNDGASQLVEYAHGGTSPIATLSDAGEYPEGCSVDPTTTGNLAVTNFYSTSGAGSVSIYAGARGSPQVYSDPGMTNYRFCGYDSKGNLFVDGVNNSSSFVLAELPKGSSSFTNIDFTQKIEWPGGVQWDGKFIAVGDTDTGTIYRTNAAGIVKGSTLLSGSNYVNQFWIVAIDRWEETQGWERRRAKPGRRRSRHLQVPCGWFAYRDDQRFGTIRRDGQ